MNQLNKIPTSGVCFLLKGALNNTAFCSLNAHAQKTDELLHYPRFRANADTAATNGAEGHNSLKNQNYWFVWFFSDSANGS